MPVLSSPLTPGAVSTIGGTGTTQKIFQSSIKNAAGVVQSPFVASVTDFLLPIPALNKANGQRIKVIMSGQVYVHGTSPTWQLQLLGSVAGSSNTVLCQTSAVSLTTNASYDWTLEANLICSTAPVTTGGAGGGGTLVGYFSSLINTTFGASATLTNTMASVNMGNNTATLPASPSGSPAFYLKAAALFGVSDAANLAALTEFIAWTED